MMLRNRRETLGTRYLPWDGAPKARRRGGNEPIPVSSSEDIAPTAFRPRVLSAPTIDPEAVVSSRGADIVVPEQRGMRKGWRTQPRTRRKSPRRPRMRKTDVIDDKDVERAK